MMKKRMPLTTRLIPRREPTTAILTGCLLATVPLKNLFTDRMGYNLDNTPINIWIERSYRQAILLYV